MTRQSFSISVEPKLANSRLDIFLARAVDGMTRSGATRLINTGDILVNSAPVKPSYKVRAGDLVSVTPSPPLPSEALPENIPLDIIYEDTHIIVINKSPEMVVHPAAGNYTGTLVNALIHHCTDLSGIGGVMRPGIVHRLDKGTSGIIVAAKDDLTHGKLAAQFKGRTVVKKYAALVFGHMPQKSGSIASSIGRDNKNRKKISSNASNKKEAVTHYEVAKYFDGFCLLELTPKTGRTHQLRVHLSEAGHPIVGDALYGAGGRINSIKDPAVRGAIRDLDRFLLHASYLKFMHPGKNEYVEFTAPLPEDFSRVLEILSK